ncbi:UvrD-helicase domain-containing protein [Kosakonia sp. ML.JS2a]|uniref:UvrD-helicase domain-containing protein n=1 Tax=Kosakonia sp. ML.JS2a TaxID=2980557 RepID=UPI0021D95BB6|nr:UvrD-helicase domain-containing protein [Kosakonia sp. ML.JS2a]UXY12213.1 UvrD-helicase domain-containing protein [Kosakonia sp. ML.JS2a]
MFIALTQGMAEWLLPKIGVIDKLQDVMIKTSATPNILSGKLYNEGPFKISVSQDNKLFCIWHSDYLIGTGQESLAIIKLSGEHSITSVPNIKKESLERSIYLANQRLQGLLVEGAFMHRKHDDNIHTLLAGRGTEARQYSIGYYDQINGGEESSSRTLLSVGPGDSFRELVKCVEDHIPLINELASTANKIISAVKFEPAENDPTLESLSFSIKNYLDEAGLKNDFGNSQIVAGDKSLAADDVYRTMSFNYDDWVAQDSPLTEAQRKVLSSEALDRYPLRILGPGGSGKTLLMQLLALKKAESAHERNEECKIMYIVHSDAMKSKVLQRFQLLAGEKSDLLSNIKISTLSEYCREKLQLSVDSILDRDADDAKLFQLQQIKEGLIQEKKNHLDKISHSELLKSVFENTDLGEIFAKLLLSEISISIKGHGLEQDKRRYVESERNLSRLHGVLSKEEREFIFTIFEWYHREVFENYGVLDPDDLALSLYGSIRTPVWRLRRKSEGFDYIFVDEAQLFNENERRLFSLLSNDSKAHVPIALALDEAQSFYGQSNAGLATLGIKDISSQNLDSIRRSTLEIAKLAFFIIQRSTNLFSSDFPDFTSIESFNCPVKSMRFGKPSIEKESPESKNFGRFILKRVRDFRSENIRQIAVICHTESFWSTIESELFQADLPFQVLRERGEKIKSEQPIVVLCRPAQVGGQEFDAVIVVGLEKGVLSFKDNQAFESAIEQQMIRETYLSITRARYKVIFAISKLSSENELIAEAVSAGLITK